MPAKDDTSNIVDITHRFQSRINERLIPPSNDGTSGGGMDGWQTSVESRLGEIKTDIRDLRNAVGTLNTSVATLAERVAHLPSKGFIVTTTLLALSFVAALVTFQSQIQGLLKIH